MSPRFCRFTSTRYSHRQSFYTKLYLILRRIWYLLQAVTTATSRRIKATSIWSRFQVKPKYFELPTLHLRSFWHSHHRSAKQSGPDLSLSTITCCVVIHTISRYLCTMFYPSNTQGVCYFFLLKCQKSTSLNLMWACLGFHFLFPFFNISAYD